MTRVPGYTVAPCVYAAFFSISFFSSTGLADVFDTFGTSASSISNGNTHLFLKADAFSAYSNPASMVTSDKMQASIQLIYTDFSLQDLPSSASEGLPPNPYRASHAENLSGTSFGLNLPVHDYVWFGISGYLPQGDIGRIRGISQYDTTYLRYSDAQQKPAVYSALAFKLPSGFSFALGAFYTLKAKGVLQINLSDEESEGRIDIALQPVMTPYGALHWQGKNISLGFWYRAAQETETRIETSLSYSNDDSQLPFNANGNLLPFYDPSTFRLSAAVNLSPIELSASWERSNWSEYKAPIVLVSGNDVAAVSTENSRRDPGLKDSDSYRLGIGFPIEGPEGHNLIGRAGIRWDSSANVASKVSSVADPSRTTYSFGGQWSLPSDDKGRRLTAELAFQYSQLASLNIQTPQGVAVDLNGKSSIKTFVGGLSYEL